MFISPHPDEFASYKSDMCLFLEDAWIYYSNDTGIFKIRTDGTENTRLSDNNASNIIVDGDYHKYILIDSASMDDRRVFRILKTDGSSKQRLNNVKTQNLVDFDVGIYYTDDLNNLYKMDFDGGNNTLLARENTKFINYMNFDLTTNWIYYANPVKNGDVYKIKSDGTDMTRIDNVNCKR